MVGTRVGMTHCAPLYTLAGCDTTTDTVIAWLISMHGELKCIMKHFYSG